MSRDLDVKNKVWKELRQKVLAIDHYECQRCIGNYYPDPEMPRRKVKAKLVHHHFHRDEFPEFKYSIWVEKDGKRVRNLVSLCNDCHEYIHRDVRHHFTATEEDDEFTTEERWD